MIPAKRGRPAGFCKASRHGRGAGAHGARRPSVVGSLMCSSLGRFGCFQTPTLPSASLGDVVCCAPSRKLMKNWVKLWYTLFAYVTFYDAIQPELFSAFSIESTQLPPCSTRLSTRMNSTDRVQVLPRLPAPLPGQPLADP